MIDPTTLAFLVCKRICELVFIWLNKVMGPRVQCSSLPLDAAFYISDKYR